MARLKLNIAGKSFLEVTFTQRDGGLGVRLSLRVASSPGRSSLVFRDEFLFDSGSDGEAYIRELFSEANGSQGLEALSLLKLHFHRTESQEIELMATWRDESGTIKYSCGIDQERMHQFRVILESSWAKLKQRAPCS